MVSRQPHWDGMQSLKPYKACLPVSPVALHSLESSQTELEMNFLVHFIQ